MDYGSVDMRYERLIKALRTYVLDEGDRKKLEEDLFELTDYARTGLAVLRMRNLNGGGWSLTHVKTGDFWAISQANEIISGVNDWPEEAIEAAFEHQSKQAAK